MREQRPTPPTPAITTIPHCPGVIPAAPGVIPATPGVIPAAPTVIPAKAGIHTPAYRNAPDLPGLWIPAYAGMTDEYAE